MRDGLPQPLTLPLLLLLVALLRHPQWRPLPSRLRVPRWLPSLSPPHPSQWAPCLLPTPKAQPHTLPPGQVGWC